MRKNGILISSTEKYSSILYGTTMQLKKGKKESESLRSALRFRNAFSC
jgi:hypothetical protein